MQFTKKRLKANTKTKTTNKKEVETMKKYNNVDWELLRDKLQGCETVAGYLAGNMSGLTIQDLQERLENLRDLIQEAREFFKEKAQD